MDVVALAVSCLSLGVSLGLVAMTMTFIRFSGPGPGGRPRFQRTDEGPAPVRDLPR